MVAGPSAGDLVTDNLNPTPGTAAVISRQCVPRAFPGRGGQFARRAAPAGYGHQQRLGLASHFRPCSRCKTKIGGDHPHPPDSHNPPMSGPISAHRSATSSRWVGMTRGNPRPRRMSW